MASKRVVEIEACSDTCPYCREERFRRLDVCMHDALAGVPDEEKTCNNYLSFPEFCPLEEAVDSSSDKTIDPLIRVMIDGAATIDKMFADFHKELDEKLGKKL
jgi:hypothetical protein